VSYTYESVQCQFKNVDGKPTRRVQIPVPHGSSWGPEQVESLARLRTGNYTDKITFMYHGLIYVQIPAETRKAYEMANGMEGFALWCKPGQHAFDPADKGRKRIMFTDFSGDTPEDITAWTCSGHSPDIARAPKAAPEIPPNADSELYTEFLAWKNGLRDEPK
jgi:hypothetical protein